MNGENNRMNTNVRDDGANKARLKSVIVKSQERIVVRCGHNQYRTPLFSYDHQGIYVRCKDCRSEVGGEVRRGTFHLYTWGMILRMALNLVTPEEMEGIYHASSAGHTGSGNDSGINNLVDEVVTATNGSGG